MPEVNEGLPVAGYQPQTQSNVDQVNTNKRLEEEIMRILDILAMQPYIDKRWLAIGRTHIEEGFMSVNRSIFRPGRVKLASDFEQAKP